jgi:hypothetical protein
MSSVRTFSRIATSEATGDCDCILALSCPRPPCSAILAGCVPVLFGRILTEAGRASSRGEVTVASKVVARTESELEGRLWWVADCAATVWGGGASGTKGFSLNSQDRCWLRLLLPMLLAVDACGLLTLGSTSCRKTLDRDIAVFICPLPRVRQRIILMLGRHRLVGSRNGLTRLLCCSRDSPPSFAQERDPLKLRCRHSTIVYYVAEYPLEIRGIAAYRMSHRFRSVPWNHSYIHSFHYQEHIDNLSQWPFHSDTIRRTDPN